MSGYFMWFGCLFMALNSLFANDLIMQSPTQTEPFHSHQEVVPPLPQVEVAPPSVEAQKKALQRKLINSSKAAEEWLNLIDSGHYEASWNSASLPTKTLMKQKEWVAYLEVVRKPLGKNMRRTLIDQRVATNPKGLAKGDYMVLFYDSSFSNKDKAKELIILQESEDGNWHVLSYNVKAF